MKIYFLFSFLILAFSTKIGAIGSEDFFFNEEEKEAFEEPQEIMDYIPEGFHNRSKRALGFNGGMIRNRDKIYIVKLSSSSQVASQYEVSEPYGIVIKKVIIKNTGGGKYFIGPFSFPNEHYRTTFSEDTLRNLSIDCYYNLGSRASKLNIAYSDGSKYVLVGDADNQVLTHGGGKVKYDANKGFTQDVLPYTSGGLGCIYGDGIAFPYKWKANGDLAFDWLVRDPDILNKKRTKTQVKNIDLPVSKGSVLKLEYFDFSVDKLKDKAYKPHILCGTKGGNITPSRVQTLNGYFPARDNSWADDEVLLKKGIFTTNGFLFSGLKRDVTVENSPLGESRCGSTEIEIHYQKKHKYN